MPQNSQIWYWLFLPVKQWREQKSSQNHFWHNDSVCPDVWAHSEVHCLPTSRVNRKNLSEIARVIKGTLISAIWKPTWWPPIFFSFSDRKWIKKCLYQIWAKSYRFWKFIETAANLLPTASMRRRSAAIMSIGSMKLSGRHLHRWSFQPQVGWDHRHSVTFYRRLAHLLGERRNTPFNVIMAWMRTRLSFALLRASTMCLRGSRVRRTVPWNDLPADVVVCEGRLGRS